MICDITSTIYMIERSSYLLKLFLTQQHISFFTATT